MYIRLAPMKSSPLLGPVVRSVRLTSVPPKPYMAEKVKPASSARYWTALFERIAAESEKGRALTLSTDLATGLTREGTGEGQFHNRYDPPRRLLIVGAVQIAQSLSALARAIGVAPVVIDPRGRFLKEERFPGVELDDRWPDEAVAARFPGESTAVVTLSHDIKIDDPALAAALRGPTGYIAALGSRKTSHARLNFSQFFNSLGTTLGPWLGSTVLLTGGVFAAGAVVTEATRADSLRSIDLAFLGLGDPNVLSWGMMIGNGRAVIRTAWYLSAVPGALIVLTVLAVNLLGEALNDAANPRLGN